MIAQEFRLTKHLLASLALLVTTSGLASAADPNGSRYDNWSQNAVWSSHYGLYTDQGWTSSKHVRVLGDANGDGMQDVVAFGEDGVYVSLSNATSFVGIAKWVNDLGYNQAWRVGANPRYTVDINGDGKADVAGFGTAGVYVGISTGSSFGTVTRWTTDFGNSSSTPWDPEKTLRMFADVNGDGKADAIGFGLDGVYVGLADPANNRFLPMTKWIANFGYNQAWRVGTYPRFMGDVNGDGKADIVGFGIPGTFVSLASNNKFLDAVMVIANFGADQGWDSDKHVRVIADVNADGMQDLVGFGDANVIVSISKGDQGGWTATTVSAQYTYDAGWRVDTSVRTITDVNGDNKADIVAFGQSGTQFALALGQNSAITFGTGAQWVNDFGYNQAWRVGEDPRFMADVNGDARPEPVGYGYYGVYVSPSASLYCCDTISFLDTGNNNQQVNGAVVGRAYLPRSELVLPTLTNPNTCAGNSTYKNTLQPVVSNGSFGGKVPWSNFYSARLMMNANFFDLAPGNPYSPSVLCTNALGFTITNTATVSPYSAVHGAATQTMAFYTPAYVSSSGTYVNILQQSDVNSQRANIQNAISGFTLLSGGVYVQQPSGIDPDSNRARAGMGITPDGKTIILAVVNNGNDGGSYPNGGTTLPGLASLLKSLGASKALTLDGSGSAQMVFTNGAVTYKSVGSDTYSGSSHLYRPVPVFFGVR